MTNNEIAVENLALNSHGCPIYFFSPFRDVTLVFFLTLTYWIIINNFKSYMCIYGIKLSEHK